MPGPNAYNPNLSQNEKGNHFYSKWKDSGAPVFSKAKRNCNLETSQTRKITPGPGAYRSRTEFGRYSLNTNYDASNMSKK